MGFLELEKGSMKGRKLTVSNSVKNCRRRKKDEDWQAESTLSHQIVTGTSMRRVWVEWWGQGQDSQVFFTIITLKIGGSCGSTEILISYIGLHAQAYTSWSSFQLVKIIWIFLLWSICAVLSGCMIHKSPVLGKQKRRTRTYGKHLPRTQQNSL